MTDKIKETTRRIDNTKDTVLKLSELRKLKIEITKLENDFIKKISQEKRCVSKMIDSFMTYDVKSQISTNKILSLI